MCGSFLYTGYDSMGYELSKPMLRAELEADLKRCADCEQSSTAVVYSCCVQLLCIHTPSYIPCMYSYIHVSTVGSVKEGSQRKV